MNIKARAKDVVRYEAFGDAGGVIEELVTQLEKAEAERDAAVAALERVREIHVRTAFDDAPDKYHCKRCQITAGTWPCPTVAALDGAHEPEWAYGRMYFDEAGDPHIRETTDVTSPDGHRADGSPYWNYRPMRRRQAGPWLPVEGSES